MYSSFARKKLAFIIRPNNCDKIERELMVKYLLEGICIVLTYIYEYFRYIYYDMFHITDF